MNRTDEVVEVAMNRKTAIFLRIQGNEQEEDFERKIIGIVKANPDFTVNQLVNAIADQRNGHSDNLEMQAGFAFLRLWVSGRLVIEQGHPVLTED